MNGGCEITLSENPDQFSADTVNGLFLTQYPVTGLVDKRFFGQTILQWQILGVGQNQSL